MKRNASIEESRYMHTPREDTIHAHESNILPPLHTISKIENTIIEGQKDYESGQQEKGEPPIDDGGDCHSKQSFLQMRRMLSTSLYCGGSLRIAAMRRYRAPQ